MSQEVEQNLFFLPFKLGASLSLLRFAAFSTGARLRVLSSRRARALSSAAAQLPKHEKRERDREQGDGAQNKRCDGARWSFFSFLIFFQPRPSLGVVVSPSKTSLALGLSSRTYLASQAVLDREGKPRRGGRGEKREKREKNEPSLPSFLLSLPPSLSHPHPLPTLKKKKSSASSSSCRARARSASASGTSPRRPASARA